MSKAFYRPWIGKRYSNAKVLVLSESAYSWIEGDGTVGHPPPTHPRNSILWGIENFPRQGYLTSMNRALCETKNPSKPQMRQMWEDYAYTIYVQRTVGDRPRKRPSSAQWEDAAQHFLNLIEKIRPLKVVVTGMDMWNRHMPSTSVEKNEHLQAYELSDGALVWCLALPHPSNSKLGFKWEEIGAKIRRFKETKLPRRK